MKITIEINNNEDVIEAIQTLEKLLVKEVKKASEKVVKTKPKAKVETTLEPSDVFALAKSLAKEHGSARVKEIIKNYGDKMADIKPEDLPKFNKELMELVS